MSRKDMLLERILAAADRMAVARGEAQWTNGYRAATHVNPVEEKRLYDKEQAQWKYVGRVEGRARKAFLSVLREARRELGRKPTRKAGRPLRRRASKGAK